MEFVFDNTRKRGLNLYYGTRLKVFAEYFKQLNLKETDITIHTSGFKAFANFLGTIVVM